MDEDLEIRYHYMIIAEHLIHLFKILLPDEPSQTIATLVGTTLEKVMNSIDSDHDWMVTMTAKDYPVEDD